MDYSHIKSLFKDWASFLNERQSSYESLLCDTSLKYLLVEHNSAIKNVDKSKAFTVFEIISDLYYRENFHSDLIAFFLDPSQNHGMCLLGIELLIDLIVKQTGWQISIDNYEDATVVREQGRIDILIKDDYSRHAILVENKMNNAGDMDRQIPRYCDILEEQGYTVEAAIYLPMLKYKTPDKSTWKESDYRWLQKIVVIPAVSDVRELSLTKDWLMPLALRCNNEDVASTLRQYVYLITKTSNYNMDKISFDKLYAYLMDEDHLDIANSFVSMMNELPQYLAQRIIDTYSERCYPFDHIWPYKVIDAVFEKVMIEGVYFKMDVSCNSRTFNVLFWAPEDKDVSRLESYKSIKEFLQEKGITVFDDYRVGKNKLSKDIPISTPPEVFIDPILAQLRAVADK